MGSSRQVYTLNLTSAMDIGLNISSKISSEASFGIGTRVTILDDREVVPTIIPQPCRNDTSARGMVSRRNKHGFMTGLDQYMGFLSQTSIRLPSQCSTPRPTLVRRNASPPIESPSSYYFSQIAPDTVPFPTTGFTAPDAVPTTPPQEPVIRPRVIPSSNAEEEGLLLLGATTGDFFVPTGGEFNLPPPQIPVASPIPQGSAKEEEFGANSQRKKDNFAMLAKHFAEKKVSAILTRPTHPQVSNDRENGNTYQPGSQRLVTPGITDQHEPWIIERKRLHMEKLNTAHIQAKQREQEEEFKKEIVEKCDVEVFKAELLKCPEKTTQEEREEEVKKEIIEKSNAKTIQTELLEYLEKVDQKGPEEKAKKQAVERINAELVNRPKKGGQGSNAALLERFREIDRKYAALEAKAMLNGHIEMKAQASGVHERGCKCNICACPRLC